jgi:hypothetical protein
LSLNPSEFWTGRECQRREGRAVSITSRTCPARKDAIDRTRKNEKPERVAVESRDMQCWNREIGYLENKSNSEGNYSQNRIIRNQHALGVSIGTGHNRFHISIRWCVRYSDSSNSERWKEREAFLPTCHRPAIISPSKFEQGDQYSQDIFWCHAVDIFPCLCRSAIVTN